MQTIIRSALFIDFDNIYPKLCKEDRRLAKKFAKDPSICIEWLERRQANGALRDTGSKERRILVRRCYMGEKLAAKFQEDIDRSGFEIIRCPSLNGNGKNGADIKIAVDAVRAQCNGAEYDEYIILSADSDFTPLLIDLRKHDKRTMIVTPVDASADFRASADIHITSTEFIARTRWYLHPEKLDKHLNQIAKGLATRAQKLGELDISDINQILGTRPELKLDDGFLGFGSQEALLEELVGRREDMTLEHRGSSIFITYRPVERPQPEPPQHEPHLAVVREEDEDVEDYSDNLREIDESLIRIDKLIKDDEQDGVASAASD